MSDPLDEDAELLPRVARGDEAAIRLLLAAKLPRVLALGTRLLRDRGEAEDVAQEAFLRVWRVAGRWETGRARFDTWLHVVVLNLCRDRLRMRRRQADPPAIDPADPAPLADERLIERDRGAAVAAAIGRLPERQREAILLVHYQDLSNIAAAEAMGVSVEAIESLLARGRRALRAMLAPAAEGGADE